MKNCTPETLEEAIAFFEEEGCECDTVEETAATKLIFAAAKDFLKMKEKYPNMVIRMLE